MNLERRVLAIIIALMLTATTVCSFPVSIYADEEETTSQVTEDPIFDIVFSLGSTFGQLNFNWYSTTSTQTPEVQIAKAIYYDETDFPVDAALTFTGSQSAGNDDYYSNKVAVSGLAASTDYVYRVGDGSTWSQTYDYTTQDTSDGFSFFLAGDPQLGASGDIESDGIGWQDTLEKAIDKFPDTDFLLSLGDQVNNGSEVADSTNELEYSQYFASEVLRSLPVMAIAGNHETYGVGHNTHFYVPNESTYGTVEDAPTTGGDYYYVYGNTIFLMLNSNDLNASDHETFIQEALDANPNVTWRVVSLHHSVYSSADHATDSDILERRSSFIPVFDEFDIDVVLDGHDHCYTRSYQMLGNVAQDQADDESLTVTNPSGSTYEDETVTNATGTVYMTFNSASGSKYYEMQEPNATQYYEAVKQQYHVPEFTNVTVDGNSFTMTTYRTDTMEITDEYTLVKGQETEEAQITDLTLAPGADASKVDVNWYTDKNTGRSQVQVIEKETYSVSGFDSSEVDTFEGSQSEGNDDYTSNKVEVTGLSPETDYMYRVGDGENWSDAYSFSTQSLDSYNFLIAGDPQIGASGDIESDSQGWADTLEKATTAFPDTSFLISLGDQVNNGSEVTDSNELEYSGYFSPVQMKNLLVAAYAGNHETYGEGHNTHFYAPNESDYGTVDEAPTTGGDYYYTYGNTLFMVLNSNDLNVSDHEEFMKEAIAASPDVTWKVVALHYSIYSSAKHSTDDEILELRQKLPSIFESLDVDIVLDGHDHCYTRTYQMVDQVAVDDFESTTTDVTQEIDGQDYDYESQVDTDPTGVVYITANSASGSKYYEMKSESKSYYEAVKQQLYVPTLSNLEVTPDSLTITTYRMDNMAITDQYTIEKSSIDTETVANDNTDKIVAALSTVNDGGDVVVDIHDNKIVSQLIYSAVKDEDKTLKFSDDDYEWTFEGTDVDNIKSSIDLSVDASLLKDTESENQSAIQEKAGKASTVVISLAAENDLPGKATLSVKMPKDWLADADKLGEELYIYHYNSSTDKMELIDEGVTLDDNGYITFELEDQGDYVVSDEDLGEPKEMTILEAREKASGKAILTGIVTNIIDEDVFVQDANSGEGICFYNSIGAEVSVGDELQLTGPLSNYHELIEITPTALDAVETLSTNNTVTPKTITIDELTNDLQGQLVKIVGATLVSINTSGSSTLTDSTGTCVIYKIPEVSSIVEGDTVDVIGTVSVYKTPEILVQKASDITKAE